MDLTNKSDEEILAVANPIVRMGSPIRIKGNCYCPLPRFADQKIFGSGPYPKVMTDLVALTSNPLVACGTVSNNNYPRLCIKPSRQF